MSRTAPAAGVGDEPASDALVVFGFTGDLARKKIIPALYAMAKKNALVVPVIGVASPRLEAAQLHARLRESIEHDGGIDDAPAFDRLLALVRYVGGDYRKPETFQALKSALGDAAQPAHYLAATARFSRARRRSRRRGRSSTAFSPIIRRACLMRRAAGAPRPPARSSPVPVAGTIRHANNDRRDVHR